MFTLFLVGKVGGGVLSESATGLLEPPLHGCEDRNIFHMGLAQVKCNK